MSRAEAQCLRGLELVEASTGTRSLMGATLLRNLGRVRTRQGQHEEALRLHREALEVQREIFGPRHPSTAETLAELGRASIEAGRPEEAVEQLEQAIEVLTGDGTEAVTGHLAAILHQARFSLARAWWDGDGDRSEARRLARAARDALAGLESEQAQVLDAIGEIDAWLAKRNDPPPLDV